MTGETPYKIKPTHIAYTVRDFTKKDTGEADSSWLKIGVAWLHKDGHGFDVPRVQQAPREGLGLTHMRERVETLGGRFAIESGSQGTLLVAEFGAAASTIEPGKPR